MIPLADSEGSLLFREILPTRVKHHLRRYARIGLGCLPIISQDCGELESVAEGIPTEEPRAMGNRLR
jgi:hypothetical protein